MKPNEGKPENFQLIWLPACSLAFETEGRCAGFNLEMSVGEIGVTEFLPN